MENKFNINRFISKDQAKKIEITVGIPNTPFRVAPIEDSKLKYFHIYRIQSKWWLIGDDLAKYLLEDEEDNNKIIQGFWKAKLYQTINMDGELRLLPVTYPKRGKSKSWLWGWLKIVEAARSNFIETHKSVSSYSHDYEVVDGHRRVQQWPNLSYSKWIELAFGDRIIETLSELRHIRGQDAQCEVIEED